MDTELESFVSRAEFNAIMDGQYPPGALTKTMRVERRDRLTSWLKLKGELSPPAHGNWRYRVRSRGYDVVRFPDLGEEEETLCLKGIEQNGKVEQGRYGEWRRVVAVEEFYDILLDTHVRVLNHAGYRAVLKAVERDYTGITRFAALKLISMCSECRTNPRHKSRALDSASTKKVIRLGAITRDFNRRCQIEVLDMTMCPDGQYSFIGLYTDHWTKFVTLFPMTGNSAEHVAYGLASSVYPYYGPPHFLHSSQGQDFADKLVQCSIDKWKGGARTVCPRGKGSLLHMGEVVEKTKELLISLINARAGRDLPQGGPLCWASWLGSIMYDINNQQNVSTSKSPYKRVFERTLVSTPEAFAVSCSSSGQSSSGEVTSGKRKISPSDDASAVLTSHKTPRSVRPLKLERPRTFVAIENHR